MVGAESKILGDVALIGTQHVLGVDVHILVKLDDHSAERFVVSQVLISTVEPDVVFALKLRPNRFLAIHRAA